MAILDEPIHPKLTKLVLDMVFKERTRQDNKWGEQNHDPAAYMLILAEEFGEVAIEANTITFGGDCKEVRHNYITELTHVAAVAVAMIEAELRRQIKKEDVSRGTEDLQK